MSEREIQKFGNKHIPPESSFFLTGDKKKIHYWMKPIERVVTKCIETLSQKEEEELQKQEEKSNYDGQRNDIKFIDIVFGGDHGKGEFRAIINMIVQKCNRKRERSMFMKVGHIDCKKDTYFVL